MNNAEEFIECYNTLDNWLRKSVKLDQHISFSQVVLQAAEKNRAVKTHEYFLKSMGNLRNAILHDSKYPRRIIATPDDSVLEEFKKVCQDIYQPRKALQVATKQFEIFPVDSFLSEVLPTMKVNNFSQIVIRHDDNSFGIISREGIARWMEANLEEDIVSLKEVTIRDIVPFEEDDNWMFISSSSTVYDAIKLFGEINRRIQALLITQNGRQKEKPIGVLTFWDISQEMIHA